MIGAIERVTLTHLTVPFKANAHLAGGDWTLRDAILVAVTTDEGTVGLGEASPAAGGGPSRCWDELAGPIATTLIGQRFGEVEAIATMTRAWAGCDRPAVAAAETACWDLLGQARHESLAEMLGATSNRVDSGIESGLTVGLYPTIVDLLRAVEPHLDEGYQRLKIEIRPGRDVDLVRALRQHFGDLPLMVHAGASYTPADADTLRALDEFDLLMIEQPYPADRLDDLAALQAELTTPIGLDATAEDPARLAEAIRRGSGRIVALRIQRLGGLGPARALYELCRQNGLACWVGTTPELGVGHAQAIHLAALANCKYPTDACPSARWFVDDYVVPLIEHHRPGILPVPTRPGLGYKVDPVKVRRYQVRHAELG
jgi:O-succinylbenzoate synthase